MQNAVSTDILTSDLSDRRLTLNLVVRSGCDVQVASCDIIAPNMRNRTSFAGCRDLHEVVVDKLACAIDHILEGLPEDAQVVSLPDFLVEMPGLLLNGVHLLVTKVRNGVRNAIVRFKEFLGSVNHMFLEDTGFSAKIADHAEQLATNVLADICLPLLNLCRELEMPKLPSPENIPDAISSRIRELEFRTELLKRYVTNSAKQTPPPAPSGYLSADEHDVFPQLPSC